MHMIRIRLFNAPFELNGLHGDQSPVGCQLVWKNRDFSKSPPSIFLNLGTYQVFGAISDEHIENCST